MEPSGLTTNERLTMAASGLTTNERLTMERSGLTTNERLTMAALKQHDRVHPTFKAKKLSPRGRKEGTATTESAAMAKRLLRVSASDAPSGGQSSSRRRAANFSVFQVVHATKTWKRFTQMRRRSPNRNYNFENTFRIQPTLNEKFLPMKVEAIIKRQMESRLTGVIYSADVCKVLAEELSDQIKDRVKALDFPRYKIVCNVVIAENQAQGIQVASRGVWNSDTDNFATYTFKSPTLVAIAYVHGVYLE